MFSIDGGENIGLKREREGEQEEEGQGEERLKINRSGQGQGQGQGSKRKKSVQDEVRIDPDSSLIDYQPAESFSRRPRANDEPLVLMRKQSESTGGRGGGGTATLSNSFSVSTTNAAQYDPLSISQPQAPLPLPTTHELPPPLSASTTSSRKFSQTPVLPESVPHVYYDRQMGSSGLTSLTDSRSRSNSNVNVAGSSTGPGTLQQHHSQQHQRQSQRAVDVPGWWIGDGSMDVDRGMNANSSGGSDYRGTYLDSGMKGTDLRSGTIPKDDGGGGKPSRISASDYAVPESPFPTFISRNNSDIRNPTNPQSQTLSGRMLSEYPTPSGSVLPLIDCSAVSPNNAIPIVTPSISGTPLLQSRRPDAHQVAFEDNLLDLFSMMPSPPTFSEGGTTVLGVNALTRMEAGTDWLNVTPSPSDPLLGSGGAGMSPEVLGLGMRAGSPASKRNVRLSASESLNMDKIPITETSQSDVLEIARQGQAESGAEEWLRETTSAILTARPLAPGGLLEDQLGGSNENLLGASLPAWTWSHVPALIDVSD